MHTHTHTHAQMHPRTHNFTKEPIYCSVFIAYTKIAGLVRVARDCTEGLHLGNTWDLHMYMYACARTHTNMHTHSLSLSLTHTHTHMHACMKTISKELREGMRLELNITKTKNQLDCKQIDEAHGELSSMPVL